MYVSLAGGGLTETGSPKSPKLILTCQTVFANVSSASSSRTHPCWSTSIVPLRSEGVCKGPSRFLSTVNAYAEPVQPGPDAGPTSRTPVADCSRASRSRGSNTHSMAEDKLTVPSSVGVASPPGVVRLLADSARWVELAVGGGPRLRPQPADPQNHLCRTDLVTCRRHPGDSLLDLGKRRWCRDCRQRDRRGQRHEPRRPLPGTGPAPRASGSGRRAKGRSPVGCPR